MTPNASAWSASNTRLTPDVRRGRVKTAARATWPLPAPAFPGAAILRAAILRAAILRAAILSVAILGAGTFGCTGGEDNATTSRTERGATEGSPNGTGESNGKATSQEELWLCPMHPTYVADHKTSCPICGMDLIPAAEFEQAGGASSVPGMASVVLSDEGIRLAGIRTQRAQTGSIESTTRTVGVVVPDESRIRRVQARMEGWIERVFVEAAGQEVRRGDPVVSIYSPELLAVQEDLVRALEARDMAPSDEARTPADALVEAARRRLQLLDVPEAFVEELERSRVPSRTVTLRAPTSGVVMERSVFQGQQVGPGMELFTVTDLSRVWIEGSFYENEARFLEAGQIANINLPYDPTVALSAEVDFIYPYLDSASRTVKVRFVVDNDFGMLKPGMYANVSLRWGIDEGVIIPDNAILETGERSIVFVHEGDGSFMPREVEVGARAGGEAQILSGIEPGEEVVMRANFLLDSESRIRAVLAGSRGAETPTGGHSDEGGGDGGGAPGGGEGAGTGGSGGADPHAGHGGR